MTFKEYKNFTKRTLPDLGSQVLNSVHMVLGFVSESYELAEAVQKEDLVNAGEEIGDKLWYLANYINVNELEFDLEFQKEPVPVSYIGQVDSQGANFFILETELADYDKKWLAYGKERDRQKMSIIATKLFYAYNNMLIYMELDPSIVMSRNIAKLLIRFPDKFTEEDANNRDLIAERAVLEGK